jgi:hypothetical protein
MSTYTLVQKFGREIEIYYYLEIFTNYEVYIIIIIDFIPFSFHLIQSKINKSQKLSKKSTFLLVSSQSSVLDEA